MNISKWIPCQSVSSENEVSQGSEFSSELKLTPFKDQAFKKLSYFMEIVIKWIPFLASLNRIYWTSFNIFLMALNKISTGFGEIYSVLLQSFLNPEVLPITSMVASALQPTSHICIVSSLPALTGNAPKISSVAFVWTNSCGNQITNLYKTATIIL